MLKNVVALDSIKNKRSTQCESSRQLILRNVSKIMLEIGS